MREEVPGGRQVIPDAAVEAVAATVQEVCETYDPGGWTEEENWAIWTRRILAVAAPHLMSAVLAECDKTDTETSEALQGDLIDRIRKVAK